MGMAAGLYLVAVPFLFYAYRLIPTTLEETTILGVSIEAGAHGNLNYYAYYFFTKVVFAIGFCIWFLTCRYWWRWGILVPIAMLLFQIMGVVNTSISYIDEFDFWYSLPVVLPILAILVAISHKLRFYAQGLDLRDEIENEIEIAQEN